MPFASFAKIREVSSEDTIHLAENLINNQTGRKWKTKNAGEKSAYVILEMTESQQIIGIDIGNEHSAFVEVLVGKSTCAPTDFVEILLTCSFMTPLESKSSNNTNRVRCFSKEALVPNVVDNKWSLVKIVCTQPFNKHVQYGLSFIKIHVQENKIQKKQEMEKKLVPKQVFESAERGNDKLLNNISKLKFRENSPDSENDKCTSLFSRWKKLKDVRDEQVGAASCSNKSSEAETRESVPRSNNLQSKKADPKIRDRNRDDIAFGTDDGDSGYSQDKLEFLSKHIEKDNERRRLERENSKSLKKIQCENGLTESIKKVDVTINSNVNLEKSNKRHSSPPRKSAKKLKMTTNFTSFNQLLKGVVLVISGVQNPTRSDIRNKALAMGAKYKADWDSSCTHLICAFKNTPKYAQVKGKGKIVTPSWIEKCYSLKKYLPWRRYALDSNDLNKPESDEEILDESLRPQFDEINNGNEERKPEFVGGNNVLSDSNDCSTNIVKEESSSECDTDDDIERVKKTIQKNERNIFDASTDEDDYLSEKYKILKKCSVSPKNF
ncbi:hypothetical protein DOY81_008770 [Sarcophaga bullata]|nr:hypothetical protein DOY81_008770 [Sarcophaga bullata]